MIDLIRKVWGLFTPREHMKVLWLVGASILTAMLQVVGVASILPFLSLLAQPQLVFDNHWINFVYRLVGFSSSQIFLIFLGFVVFGLMVASNVLEAGTVALSQRFIWGTNHKLSTRLLKAYLARPYVTFLRRNSADLGKNILMEVQNFTNGILSPLIDLIVAGTSTLFVISLLIFLDPVLAVLVSIILGGAYGVTFMVIRKRLRNIGKKRLAANTMRFKTVNEALGGVKDVKVFGKEAHFVERFSFPSLSYTGLNATSQILKVIPQYILETVAFGGILLIVLYLMAVKDDVRQIIPVVGLYAFAGYRLMPSLRQIFAAISQMRFHQVVVQSLFQDLQTSTESPVQETERYSRLQTLCFERSIQLSNVTFSYPGTTEPVIRDVDLTIQRNQVIGFVGPTGAGKTTLVDILLGLVTPQTGFLIVDGVRLTPDNIRIWQTMLGYVPQHIYLLDDTITRNIAFGVPPLEIDKLAVERAARIANLHEFIVNDLPAGYETSIGERGVRLSGGQRQRIGIARALYHDPDILIMDEATSSLDGITEDSVMKAIDNIVKTKTLIMIAHRLTTVRDCDIIYLVEDGRIVAEGGYLELMKTNPMFKSMAQSTSVPG